MKTIDDGRKIHSAMNVARELSISPKTVVDTALKLNAVFLVRTPEDTEIYLRDSYKKLLVNRWGNWGQVLNFNRNERTIAATLNASYLCLDPSDYEPIVPMGQIQIKEFKAIAKLETNYEITILDAATYTSLYSPTEFKGTFDSFYKEKTAPLMPPSNPGEERVITVEFADLLMTSKDLQSIREELTHKRPAYGKFQVEEWTSTMLAQLNEASTHFLSGESINVEKSVLRSEIITWFRYRWEGSSQDVLEQAANAILPDSMYNAALPRSKVNDSLRNEHNKYASTALILINEKSKVYWENLQSGKIRTFPKRKTIIDELCQEYNFTVKLASTTAAIIRPNAK
ncbi:hypothetical protein KRR23_09765 [Pseudomonas sp. CVAP|uniref:hypothetical protein n=1 Tax=Pseudomonas sp. CVAP\|nr:hypothetical protein [Pseudomonas sp. CVAP\